MASEVEKMTFELKYINVFDDINSSNITELQEFYNSVDLKISGKFSMPSFDESEALKASLNGIKELTADSAKRHLMAYSALSDEVATEISKGIVNELMVVVPSKPALVTNYGKIAYWAKTAFNGVLNNIANNVYIENTPNKHELYMIYILSKLGNNIVIVDEALNKENYKLYNNVLFNISNTKERKKLSEDSIKDINELISLLDSDKARSLKLVVTGETSELNNKMFELGAATPANMAILQAGITKPSYDETQSIKRLSGDNIKDISKRINTLMFKLYNHELAQKAINFIGMEVSAETNVGKAANRITTFIIYCNRYKIDNKNILLVYGKLDTDSEIYLRFLQKIGKTIIVVTSTKLVNADELRSNGWSILDLGSYSDELHQYPTTQQVSTLAYQATQEINNTIYNGATPGLYRARQYGTCDIANLKCTLDDITILWNQDSVFRPAFTSTDKTVTVPVIFKELRGVTEHYESLLGKLITQHSLICYSPSEIMQGQLNEMVINHCVCIKDTTFAEQKLMYKNGHLDIKEIKKYRNFTYRFLEEDVQNHILSKIDKLISENWIKASGNEEERVNKILNITLNLSERIQQEMQWHDFTKQSPKLIVLCQNREKFTFEQSVITMLLHLCGWDVIIATPTCYNILGDSFKMGEIERIDLGEPKFDTHIISLRPVNNTDNEKKLGFFKRLFG